MKDVLVKSNKGKFSIISAILLGALALAVIAGLGAAARADAASSSTTDAALLGRNTMAKSSNMIKPSAVATKAAIRPIVAASATTTWRT